MGQFLLFEAPRYVYTATTNNATSRGSVQPDKREQAGTGAEGGRMAGQFAPMPTSDQYERYSANVIKFRVQGNDTSSPAYGTVARLNDAILGGTMTVGSSVFTAETVNVAGTNSRPTFELTVTDNSVTDWWNNANLDDTDDIIITVTLTFKY